MPLKIKIIVKDIVLEAELFDTATAKAVAAAKGAKTITLERY